MALAALLASFQLLKCATQEPLQLTIKDIVEHHTPGWKEHLRIKLKLVMTKASCGCLGSKQKWTPTPTSQCSQNLLGNGMLLFRHCDYK
jgi:hypothetical protein